MRRPSALDVIQIPNNNAPVKSLPSSASQHNQQQEQQQQHQHPHEEEEEYNEEQEDDEDLRACYSAPARECYPMFSPQWQTQKSVSLHFGHQKQQVKRRPEEEEVSRERTGQPISAKIYPKKYWIAQSNLILPSEANLLDQYEQIEGEEFLAQSFSLCATTSSANQFLEGGGEASSSYQQQQQQQQQQDKKTQEGTLSPSSAYNNNNNVTHHHRYFPINSPQQQQHHNINLSSSSSYGSPNIAPVVRCGGSTFSDSLLNAMNMLAGIGLLSLPYSLRVSGWIGLTIIPFFALICMYTGRLLGKMMAYNRAYKGYTDLGTRTLGRKGHIVLCIVFFLEIYLFLMASIILMAECLVSLFPYVSTSTWMIFSILFVYPSALVKDLSKLSWLSFLSLAGTVFLSLVMVFFAFEQQSSVDANGISSSPLSSTTTTRSTTCFFGGMYESPIAIGLVMACFSGHALFPAIHADMAEPAKYNKVVAVSFGTVTPFYIILSVVGYMMYASNVNEVITLNFPPESLFTKISLALMVAISCTKFGLNFNGIALPLEDLLDYFISSHKSTSEEDEDEEENTLLINNNNNSTGSSSGQVFHQQQQSVNNKKKKTSSSSLLTIFGARFAHVLLRTILCFLVLLSAFLVPHFAGVQALSGALLSMAISVVFPCWMNVRLFRRQISKMERNTCYVIIFISTILGLLATLVTAKELILMGNGSSSSDGGGGN